MNLVPRGGDELNLIAAAKIMIFQTITYGIGYDETIGETKLK
jgi:hypothetical protein